MPEYSASMAWRTASIRSPLKGWKKRDSTAEGLGEVAGPPGQPRQVVEGDLQFTGVGPRRPSVST